MDILVCVKRVPMTGSKITLTADEQMIDTKHLGFAMSPHEECAVEEAVRIVKDQGGFAKVLTLGEVDAVEQLRYALSMGINEAVLLEVDAGSDWDPTATAGAILAQIKEDMADGQNYDLLFFGNESADSGGYQVGVRVAYGLGWPIVTGIKALEFDGNKAIGKRETSAGWEIFEVEMPAVFSMKEGINLPRYPSVPGRLKAKKKKIPYIAPEHSPAGPDKVRLKTPPADETEVEMLGEGPAAASRVVDILEEIGAI